MAQGVKTASALINRERFWQSGAFLRLKDNQFLLFEGPFEKSDESRADIASFEFFGTEEQWWKTAKVHRVDREELRRLFETELGPRHLTRADFKDPLIEQFEASFRLVQGKIQREEIEKAVPILQTRTTKKPTPSDLAHALFSMWNLPESLNVYGFWNAGSGVLGATPEILFELQDGTLRSMALAGSCPKAELNERLPLLKDAKELKEHQLVVDDLAIRLKTLGWMRQDPIALFDLPTLQHLITRFEVVGVTKTPKELVRQLHPTAAMGVAPRAYGHQWLKELSDQKDRGLFGAPLMFRVGPSQFSTLVAIRSLFWNGEGSKIFAGCGVVSASQLEREFAEILAKMESVFQMMGLKS